jgi:hypothetical protein
VPRVVREATTTLRKAPPCSSRLGSFSLLSVSRHLTLLRYAAPLLLASPSSARQALLTLLRRVRRACRTFGTNWRSAAFSGLVRKRSIVATAGGHREAAHGLHRAILPGGIECQQSTDPGAVSSVSPAVPGWHQSDEPRARLTGLEQQWAASRQAAARAPQRRRSEAFWAERLRACDELIAMIHHSPWCNRCNQLPTFNPALLTDPALVTLLPAGPLSAEDLPQRSSGSTP